MKQQKTPTQFKEQANDKVRIYHIEHKCCSASPQNKEQGFLWINLQHISIRSLNINVSTSRSSDCILYKYHRVEYTRPHSTHLKSIHNENIC